MGGANLADAEIAENVDRVVGVEEGAGKRHVCDVLDAWRAEKSGGGVVKEIVEGGHLLLLEIGHKHDGTRSDERHIQNARSIATRRWSTQTGD